MQRGEVWWMANPPPPARDPGRHMVLLLSWDSGLRVRDRVTVAPVTTTIRGLETEVELGHPDGLPRRCVVNVDVLATVETSRLTERVTRLSLAKMAAAERALHHALGIDLPCRVR